MRAIRRTHCCVLFTLVLSAAVGNAAEKPPVAAVRDVTTTYYGQTVSDPYRYFENLKDPEVAGWMRAQADYTRRLLHRVPGRTTLLKEIERYGDAATARILDLQMVGHYIYFRKLEAGDNVAKLYVRDGMAGDEHLLVDPEVLSTPGVHHYSIDYWSPSPDNRYLAYGVSPDGSEASVIHVLDVATGKPTGDVIDRAEGAAPSWLPDGRLLYQRLQALPPNAPATDKYRNQRAFVHVLGANPDTDIAVFGAGVVPGISIAATETGYVGYSPGAPYVYAIAFNGVQRELRVWAAALSAFDGAKTPWTTIADTADGVIDFDVHDQNIFLVSHRSAPRYQVLRTSLANPQLAAAEVIVPPSDAVITGLRAAGDALYVRKMNAGYSELHRRAWTPDAVTAKITLPWVGSIENLTADPRQPGVVFFLGGWTRFGQYYAFDPKTGLRDTGLAPQGEYDTPAHLIATEVKVKADDGMRVPLSIIHRDDVELDGKRPTVVYGYGAYGLSEAPFYRPTWLPWFDRGGVLAVAHVRGGGEYGEDWYKGGFQATKPNTWRDAIACAQWLIANGYTATPQLSVMGGSAGGILVGRAITERPDLFGAAVDQVPASDMLRMEVTANGAPNVPEFGSIATAAGFKALYAMSPYQAIKDGTAYPAVLLTTGINDPRVDAWEAAKMAARLQAASTSDKPILLRVEYDGGHGIGSTKKQQYDERADTFAFLLWQAGIPEFQP